MYNQYIPQDTSYEWVGEGNQSPAGNHTPSGGAGSSLFRRLRGFLPNTSEGEQGLGGILKNLLPEQLDSGDILLLLIALLLFTEDEDRDLAIALGLVFLLDLGGGRQKPFGEQQ